VVASEKRDASTDVTALQEIGELFHDEAGKAVAARGLLGLFEERREVFADDLADDRVLGFAGRVADAGHRTFVAAGEDAGGKGRRTGSIGMAAGRREGGGDSCGLRVAGCRLWERLSKIKERAEASCRRRPFAGFGGGEKIGGGLEAGDAGLEPGDVLVAMSGGATGVSATGGRAVREVAIVGVERMHARALRDLRARDLALCFQQLSRGRPAFPPAEGRRPSGGSGEVCFVVNEALISVGVERHPV
jgi:hypothetical protein